MDHICHFVTLNHRQLKHRRFKLLPELPLRTVYIPSNSYIQANTRKTIRAKQQLCPYSVQAIQCSSAVLRIVRHNNKSMKRIFFSCLRLELSQQFLPFPSFPGQNPKHNPRIRPRKSDPGGNPCAEGGLPQGRGCQSWVNFGI